MPEKPFWKQKQLSEMTGEEWESLCDGCGRCCLIKLEDDETGERVTTRIACHMLDIGLCRCRDYENRHQRVPDCIPFTPERLGEIDWMPSSCAYRLVNEGQDLNWWHPLISGDPNSVHAAGISIRRWAVSEQDIEEEDYYGYEIDNL
ncbi:MAG: YcgN family cysteine cluster protein [Methyloligellaceae bacterium]